MEDWPAVNGWRIIGVLGAGGMGRVFHGELLKDGTPGALKVLNARWSENPEAAARFESEIAALSRLDHPDIVRVIEPSQRTPAEEIKTALAYLTDTWSASSSSSSSSSLASPKPGEGG